MGQLERIRNKLKHPNRYDNLFIRSSKCGRYTFAPNTNELSAMSLFRNILLLCVLSISLLVQAQGPTPPPAVKPFPELKLKLNDDGSHYVKLTFLNQIWLRFNESNPGSTVFDTAKDNTFDIGLRRTRLQLFGQLTDRVFFYMQFGMNNFNYLSARKVGAFFHDVVAEFTPIKKHLAIGAGLTGWTGPGRFSSPSVASILMLDAPLAEQTTNDLTDQFLRKLSVYAKGKIGKLDYRLALSTPLPTQTAPNPIDQLGPVASWSPKAPKPQVSGYFMYQFWDQESNLIPYNSGTYLGKKRVFNIGAGFEYQPKALWNTPQPGDTAYHNLLLLAADVFYDAPLRADNPGGLALSAYGAYMYNDFGPNYVRNLGVMNPANGVTTGSANANGPGNAYPIIGTGHLAIGEVGLKLPDGLLGSWGTLQPYVGGQVGVFDHLTAPAGVLDAGVNWLIQGHNAKISLNYQNRPVCVKDPGGSLAPGTRISAITMQLQITI